MNLYINVDQNGDLTDDRAIRTLENIALSRGVSPSEFNADTYELPEGYDPIIVNEPPENLTKYQVVEATPIAKNANGEWVLDFIIGEADDERKLYIDGYLTNEARRFRNVLLANSDWSQLPDAPLSTEKKALWTAYRQELRDITSNPGFPVYHKFPITPQ